MGTVGMSVVTARRYGGAWAGALAALLLAGFTLGIYFNSIVKTYALVSFCFAATLFVLSSHIRDNCRYPLALAFALAASLVRVTAAFFVAPILLFVFLRANRLARLMIVLEGIGALLLAGV